MVSSICGVKTKFLGLSGKHKYDIMYNSLYITLHLNLNYDEAILQRKNNYSCFTFAVFPFEYGFIIVIQISCALRINLTHPSCAVKHVVLVVGKDIIIALQCLVVAS